MYTVVSFDGLALNDGNFQTILEQKKNRAMQVTVQPILASRGPFAPSYGGKTRAEHYWTLTILPLHNPVAQTHILKQRLAIVEQELKPLVVMDDAGRLWTALATPVLHTVDDLYTVMTLLIPDGIFYAVDGSSDNWVITASGQTKTLTVRGDYPARPVLTVTPTAVKSGGFVYREFRIIYNSTDFAATGYALDIAAGLNLTTLYADASVSNQINQAGGINASVTTIPIDTAVGGGLPIAGMGYVDSEQIRWTGKTGSALTGVTRGIGGTTAATHADNAVIKRSKVLVNGDDVRVFMDGAEIPRWFGGTSKLWVNVNLEQRRDLILKTPIDDGSVTALVFAQTKATKNALEAMPAKGYVLIENEVLAYAGKDPAKYTLSGITRAQMGTSAASHAANLTCRWIEHVFEVAYGNQLSNSPEQTDEFKPAFDLVSSSNTSWVYTAFGADTGLNSAAWKPAVLKSSGAESETYTGPQYTQASPWTEIGLAPKSWQQAGVWKGETFGIEWQLFMPFGLTHITSSGLKYRYTADWPKPALQKSNNGTAWTTQWTENTPSSVQTWGAWSKADISLGGTYRWLRFYWSGSLTAKAENVACFEAQAVTLTLPSANVPQVMATAATDAYEFSFTIQNTSTGDILQARFITKLGTPIQINCEYKTATDMLNGANLFSGIIQSPAFDWMTLQVGENVLQYDDEGTSGVQIGIAWTERA